MEGSIKFETIENDVIIYFYEKNGCNEISVQIDCDNNINEININNETFLKEQLKDISKEWSEIIETLVSLGAWFKLNPF